MIERYIPHDGEVYTFFSPPYMLAVASYRKAFHSIRRRGAGPYALHPATTWCWMMKNALAEALYESSDERWDGRLRCDELGLKAVASYGTCRLLSKDCDGKLT